MAEGTVPPYSRDTMGKREKLLPFGKQVVHSAVLNMEEEAVRLLSKCDKCEIEADWQHVHASINMIFCK